MELPNYLESTAFGESDLKVVVKGSFSWFKLKEDPWYSLLLGWLSLMLSEDYECSVLLMLIINIILSVKKKF